MSHQPHFDHRPFPDCVTPCRFVSPTTLTLSSLVPRFRNISLDNNIFNSTFNLFSLFPHFHSLFPLIPRGGTRLAGEGAAFISPQRSRLIEFAKCILRFVRSETTPIGHVRARDGRALSRRRAASSSRCPLARARRARRRSSLRTAPNDNERRSGGGAVRPLGLARRCTPISALTHISLTSLVFRRPLDAHKRARARARSSERVFHKRRETRRRAAVPRCTVPLYPPCADVSNRLETRADPVPPAIGTIASTRRF